MNNNRLIRKISIGVDYPHNCMHFERGQRIENKRERTLLFTITDIVKLDNEKKLLREFTDKDTVFDIYIVNTKGETMLWDSFVNMPIVVQYQMYL